MQKADSLLVRYVQCTTGGHRHSPCVVHICSSCQRGRGGEVPPGLLIHNSSSSNKTNAGLLHCSPASLLPPLSKRPPAWLLPAAPAAAPVVPPAAAAGCPAGAHLQWPGSTEPAAQHSTAQHSSPRHHAGGFSVAASAMRHEQDNHRQYGWVSGSRRGGLWAETCSRTSCLL